jgi:hypothetical protein
VKYARIERERRFLLAALPAGLGAPTQITDHYLLGMRLRLRRMDPPVGPSVFKLGQKDEMEAPHHRRMTTIYLQEHEYLHLLERLEAGAAKLVKLRHPWMLDGRRWVVDVLGHRPEIIAELEAEEAELMAVLPPPGTLREITGQRGLSCASLAMGAPTDPGTG